MWSPHIFAALLAALASPTAALAESGPAELAMHGKLAKVNLGADAKSAVVQLQPDSEMALMTSMGGIKMSSKEGSGSVRVTGELAVDSTLSIGEEEGLACEASTVGTLRVTDTSLQVCTGVEDGAEWRVVAFESLDP
mmetsp:Transcript_17007/g.45892  ORF Transcript_17007/g.45892 Transcript_17007/m.45892 type:complete len:137 (-) Transcript_17007:475-885(-)